MKKSIGQNIAYYRKKMGITQEGLAEKMNVTSQAVSKWENDLSYPDPDGLKKLAVVLDISMDTLFHGEDAVVPVKEIVTDDFGKRILSLKIMVKDPNGGKRAKVILRYPVQTVLRKAEEEGGLESLFGENASVVRKAISIIKSGAVGNVLDVETGCDGDEHLSVEATDYQDKDA